MESLREEVRELRQRVEDLHDENVELKKLIHTIPGCSRGVVNLSKAPVLRQGPLGRLMDEMINEELENMKESKEPGFIQRSINIIKTRIKQCH